MSLKNKIKRKDRKNGTVNTILMCSRHIQIHIPHLENKYMIAQCTYISFINKCSEDLKCKEDKYVSTRNQLMNKQNEKQNKKQNLTLSQYLKI